MKTMRIAYFGTPYFSAKFLEKLISDKSLPVEIISVITKQDQPAGRKQVVTSSPVKQMAIKFHLPVIIDLKDPQLTAVLKQCDFAFLFAYGGIIPQEFLTQPRLGFLNTHPSLLPKYRGPSPMAYPLMLGDTQTGVTVIQLDKAIDHGPILFQEQLAISLTDCRPDLELKLTDLAYELFKKLILLLSESVDEKLHYQDQDDKNATITRLFIKEDGFIPFPVLQKALRNEPLNNEDLPIIIKDYLTKNSKYQNPKTKQISKSKNQTKKQISFEHLKIDYWNLIGNWRLEIGDSSKIIYDYFRGLYPWPGIWTLIHIKGEKKRLKICDVQYSDNRLMINVVQLEGKNEVDFKTFQSAYQIF